MEDRGNSCIYITIISIYVILLFLCMIHHCLTDKINKEQQQFEKL